MCGLEFQLCSSSDWFRLENPAFAFFQLSIACIPSPPKWYIVESTTNDVWSALGFNSFESKTIKMIDRNLTWLCPSLVKDENLVGSFPEPVNHSTESVNFTVEFNQREITVVWLDYQWKLLLTTENLPDVIIKNFCFKIVLFRFRVRFMATNNQGPILQMYKAPWVVAMFCGRPWFESWAVKVSAFCTLIMRTAYQSRVILQRYTKSICKWKVHFHRKFQVTIHQLENPLLSTSFWFNRGSSLNITLEQGRQRYKKCSWFELNNFQMCPLQRSTVA